MKKICSVTGFVPARETITQTAYELGVSKEQLKGNIENGLYFSKEECETDTMKKAKKVKVTVWISVEVIPEKAKKK